MNFVIFLLLIGISIAFIYLVHKYFSKNEFYILGIIYSIFAFLMSFKITEFFGFSVNLGTIFMSSLITILYYFVNRYDKKETVKFIIITSITVLSLSLLLILNGLILPSINDKMSVIYQDLIFKNLPIVILFPISMIGTMILSGYSFGEIKKETNKRLLKNLLVTTGIAFVNVGIFIYFSYAFIIRFDTSMMISLENYVVMMLILITNILVVNKIFNVKKVK